MHQLLHLLQAKTHLFCNLVDMAQYPPRDRIELAHAM